MNNKMTFSTLIEQIAEDTGTPKNQIHDLLKEATILIEEGLLRDGRVSIAGLGIFNLKWHKARPGRNPQTGEPIEIPAQNRVHFKPVANLRRFINRDHEGLKPVILDDEDALTAVVPTADPEPKIETRPEPTAVITPEVTPEPAPDPELNPDPKPKPVIKTEEQEIKPEPKPESNTIPEPETKAGQDQPTQYGRKHRSMIWVPVIVIILLLILIAGYFYLKPADKTGAEIAKTDHTETSTPAVTQNTPESEYQEETQQTDDTPPETSNQVAQQPAVENEADEGNRAALPGTEHTIQPGDSLWIVSTLKYSEPYFWPYIYRVNLEKIQDPDVLEEGITITAPDLEGTSERLSQQDRKNLADGYVQAYLTYKKLGKQKALLYLWVAEQFGTPEVIELYKNEIAESDLETIASVKGITRIQ